MSNKSRLDEVTHAEVSSVHLLESGHHYLPDRLIIVAREGWGNTDFLEFARGAKALGVDVRFVGYPSTRSVDFTPIVHIPHASLGPLGFTLEAAQICRGLLREDPTKVTAIHVRYFKTCALLPYLIGARAALDFRSGSIRPSAALRAIENSLMWLEALAFERVTVISKGVGKILGLRRFFELPLGASNSLLSIPREQPPDPAKLKFIYIGTLNQRNIHIFASAFAGFVADTGLDWHLDIHGYGSNKELSHMGSVTRRWGSVCFHGPLARTEVPKRLSEADIGVSFIPITPYFDHQPPTKTIEYIMAGLPTLATRTAANSEIVTENFGWLCNDTEASVQEALDKIHSQKGAFMMRRDALRDRTWEAIFADRYLKEILHRHHWVL